MAGTITIQKASRVQDAITDCVNNLKYLGKCVDELVDGALAEETGDIKQAAKWLDEGKKVRRKAWGTSPCRLYVPNGSCTVLQCLDNGTPMNTSFSLYDLLADDWVVVK